MGKKGKQVLARQEPGRTQRSPHAAAVPDESTERIVWRLAKVDLDGQWGWRNLDVSLVERILKQLKDFEGMTVGELFNRGGNKPIPADSICKQAQDRLKEIQADDLDELWELRLGNKPRIWGTRSGHIYHLLWWDPDHTVCPSKLRHT